MKKTEKGIATPENVIIETHGVEIEIKPFISLAEMVGLIQSYVSTYFHSTKKDIDEDSFDVINAEYTLKLQIVDLFTSLPIEGDFDNIFYSGVYGEIENKIENYWEFRGILEEVVSNIKEQIAQKNSIGSMLDSLYGKVQVLVEQLISATENLTPEQLEKLKETGKELVDKISQNPIAKELFADASRGK
jgi:hypothetical protein